MLMIVTNNRFGISTDLAHGPRATRPIADRAIPYGIRAETVDGNDPVATWNAIDRAMRYCRRERKPFLLEAMVSPAARPLVVERGAAELERGRPAGRCSSRS